MTGRTFQLKMPSGTRLLSANDRPHWTAKARITAELREIAGWAAKTQKIPHLDRVSITAEYQPGDRRRRDADNLAPSVKAAIDGMRDAGVIADDSAQHVTSVTYKIGEHYPRGRLVLHIHEEVADEKA